MGDWDTDAALGYVEKVGVGRMNLDAVEREEKLVIVLCGQLACETGFEAILA